MWFSTALVSLGKYQKMHKLGKSEPQEFMCYFNIRCSGAKVIPEYFGWTEKFQDPLIFLSFFFTSLIYFFLPFDSFFSSSHFFPFLCHIYEEMSKLFSLAYKTFLDMTQAYYLANAIFYSLHWSGVLHFPQKACFSWMSEHLTCLYSFAVSLFPLTSSLLTFIFLLCPM